MKQMMIHMTFLPWVMNMSLTCCFRRGLVGALVVWLGVAVPTTSADEDRAVTPRAPWTTSRLHGTPTPPAPYRLSLAFRGIRFDKPTCIEEMPAEDRMLVTERGGKVFSFRKTEDVQQAELVVDLGDLLPSDVAGGDISLFSAAFHPKFRDNRYLFVCYVHPAEGQHTRVSRFKLTDQSPPRAVPNSEHVVITWPAGGHNGGCLRFGIDGYLYISTGDGWGPNPPDHLNTGQDVSDLRGSILRINVDVKTDEQAYEVPADNPFIELPGARPEIWAYGLRNPWKIGVDRQTGEIWAADNGWESWESIHRVQRGGNCGWPIMEGRAVLRGEVEPGPTPIIPAIKDHPHTEANSVIGGPLYRGRKLPDLTGSFVYGDYITGTIWALKADGANAYHHTTLVDTDQRIVAFAEGTRGELYVLDYDFTGQVYELLPSGLQDTSAAFPRRLSETGLFASVQNLQPSAGVVPYDVKAQPWMDGADARRWVAVPGKGRIRLSTNPEEPAVYPDGTVFVKHLSLSSPGKREPLRLETQLLHYERGTWRPYSYVWDDTGRDAELVDAAGSNRTLQLADTVGNRGTTERTWHVGAENECRLCHNAGSRFVLGFSPYQLDRSLPYGDSDSMGQLAALNAREVLAGAAKVRVDNRSRLVDPHDASRDLDERARSYLHVNCGMCHHPGGNAIVSFYLRRDLPLSQLNTDKGTGIGTFGIRDAKILVPGDPYRSLLLYRMSKLGYARMPYIGSQAVDSTGVTLIEKWIRSLASDSSQEASPPATHGTPESNALRVLAEKEVRQHERRNAAVRELLKTTEGTLALIVQMHRGSLDEEDLRSAVALGRESPSRDIRGLLEHFVPESQRRARLGPNFDPQVILGRAGDAARGKLIFFSDTARCRACHDINDPDESVGPTLAEISKKYPRAAELLQHTLRPSLKIDDPFAAYSVVTDDGRTFSGLVVETDDKEVVLKTADKKRISITRSAIDEMQKSGQSLMPQFILSDLTAQEAADLTAYILGLGEGASAPREP